MPIMLNFLLLNVKTPTIIGILTLKSRKISCWAELHMKIFFKLGGQVPYPAFKIIKACKGIKYFTWIESGYERKALETKGRALNRRF